MHIYICIYIFIDKYVHTPTVDPKLDTPTIHHGFPVWVCSILCHSWDNIRVQGAKPVSPFGWDGFVQKWVVTQNGNFNMTNDDQPSKVEGIQFCDKSSWQRGLATGLRKMVLARSRVGLSHCQGHRGESEKDTGASLPSVEFGERTTVAIGRNSHETLQVDMWRHVGLETRKIKTLACC